MDFKDKTVLITGASSGIGLAIAETFSSYHAKVICVQRRDCELPNCINYNADLSCERQTRQAVEKILLDHSHIDVLVNNAGIMIESAVETHSLEQWDSVMYLNLRVPFMLTQMITPSMKTRKRGAIINISSVEAIASNPEHSAYCTSKAGLNGLTRACAVELGAYGIRCNSVAPGWIDTELNRQFIATMQDASSPFEFDEKLANIHPLKRIGQPQEIANLVCWLANDQSSFITGQCLIADGGRLAKLSLPD